MYDVPIVDCRSGKRVSVGEWVRYPSAGEDDWKLVDVLSVGLLSARLAIGRAYDPVRDAGKTFLGSRGSALAFVQPHGPEAIVVSRVTYPVRWFHAAGDGAWRIVLVPT